jgi:hypothetical protein
MNYGSYSIPLDIKGNPVLSIYWERYASVVPILHLSRLAMMCWFRDLRYVSRQGPQQWPE